MNYTVSLRSLGRFQKLEKYPVSIFTFEKRISRILYCAVANRRFSQPDGTRSKDRGIDRKRLGFWGLFLCVHDRLLATLVSSHLGIIGVFRRAGHIWQLLRP